MPLIISTVDPDASFDKKPEEVPRWKEVKDNLDPAKFAMASLPERLDKKGDLFKDWNSERSKLRQKILLKL